jgi:hypothetical protein
MIRTVDSWEAAHDAAASGMRAILLKDHHVSTAPHAYLSNKHLKTGANFQAFGSLCLNNASGGLNPNALDSSIKLGIKLVYFPTISAQKHIKLFSSANRRPEEFVSTKVPPMTEEPITVLDDDCKLKPVVKLLIDIIAEADIILATGHLDYEETLAVVKYAKMTGVNKICLTHLPMFTTMDKEKLKKIVDIGGIVEITYQLLTELTPTDYRWTPNMVTDYIRFFGVERCLFSTDFGHISCPPPIEGMRMSIKLLIDLGFTDNEIEIMIKKNPAKLLGID